MLRKQQLGRFSVPDAAPDLALPSDAAVARAEALCWALYQAGYNRVQAGRDSSPPTSAAKPARARPELPLISRRRA